MKKILQIVLVLTTLALFSTACSKVRTTNLIGTYKNGTSTMSVNSEGLVNFRIPEDATGVIKSFSKLRSTTLIPWDLTSEKPSYDYSFEDEIYEYSGGANTVYKVSLKFNFTKDKETVTCKASITVPEGKGESGTVTFSK
ncbi:hypothetical protein [Brachyspira sp.]|uniref:hypothetical protein n=1 Tax=Brachyspira sp. TaxID=1977261 RepID=UPI00263A09C5|nr:hypothetical protein [Brachyspira sp.]